MRVGSVKNAKKHSYGSPGKKKKKIGHDHDDDAVVDSVDWRHKQDPKNTDRHGSCKKCALKKMGKTNRKAHAKWCPESQDYKKKAAALLVSNWYLKLVVRLPVVITTAVVVVLVLAAKAIIAIQQPFQN